METMAQSKTIRHSSHSLSTVPDTFKRAGQDAKVAGLYLEVSVERARSFCPEATTELYAVSRLRGCASTSGILAFGEVIARLPRGARARGTPTAALKKTFKDT
jgi:hypothetical protein